MKVYIVIKTKFTPHKIMSVWSTNELAQSAILYHFHRDMENAYQLKQSDYYVLEREVNVALNDEAFGIKNG